MNNVKIKMIAATICWSAAIAFAVGRSASGVRALSAWVIVTAAAAVVLTTVLAGDFIAQAATRHILERVTAERNATVDRATRAIGETLKSTEDRVVSRVASANEASLHRVAEEIARELRGDRPTRLR